MRHLSHETLLEHASGQLDLALRVLAEAHLDLCPACRSELATLVAPGGRWIAEAAAAEAPAELWSRLAATLPAQPGDPLPAHVPLPPAARAELPPAAGPLRWWRLGLAGAKMAQLAHDEATGVSLLVGYMPPKLRFPRHEHLGFEHVVVLSGGYEDERGDFVAGDFGVYEPGSEHGPQTLDGDDCWILFRLDGAVRFRGWRGLLQRLVD